MKRPALISIIFLIALLFTTSACKKDIPEDVDNMRQMIIPNEFNYQIQEEISLTITLPATVDYADRNRLISIYNDLPQNGGSLINAGAAGHDGVYKTSIRVSSSLEELYIHSFAGWKQVSLVPLMKGMNDGYSIDYNEDYSNAPPDTIPEGQPVKKPVFLVDQPLLKSGGNFIGNPGFENDDFDIQPYWSSSMSSDGKWHITSLLSESYLLAEVEDGKVMQINGSGSGYGGVTQLVDVEPGEELTLTADINMSGNVRAWLYLIPRNANQQPLSYPNLQVTGTRWQTRTVAAEMPANAVSCQVLLWSHNYSGSVIQYDNVILTIKGRVTDTDGDGVDDDEDAYPNDADKAFNSYYPAENTYGTLAFEDMWPNAGDYDFNDLVIGYRFNHIKNSSNLITSLTADFQLRAIGASISNGFGFEMDISPDLVESVNNSLTFSSDQISLSANGTESQQQKATIIAFSDAFDVLIHPGTGLGINTNPEIVYQEPTAFSIEIDFTEPLSLENIGNAPNNPFIFRTANRSWEIHLPGYYPTDLADAAKFGTGDDATNLENAFLYKTAKGLPWGMNLPVTFIYPIEKVPIIEGYLKFQQWAVSGGYSFMDWFESIEGYRNNSKLYLIED